MAMNKALALLLLAAIAAAPLAQALTAPLNAATNVRCCGTGPTGGCVDTGASCKRTCFCKGHGNALLRASRIA